VRYADDFIVTANSKELLENVVIPKINVFLKRRGVQLSEQKTKITHISEGFDFLGQTIRKYQRRDGSLGKIQIEPSQTSIQSIKNKVKAICKSSGQLTQAQMIDRLNPVLRGWGNYHRHIICGETYSKINSYVWFRLMRWGKRRHPEKSGIWIAKRYFGHAKGSTWAFMDKATGKTLIRLNNDINTFRHIKILGEANPFDAQWNGYFHNREKLIKMKSVSHYIGKVSKQQDGKCPHCKEVIQAEDKHHLHYIDGDKTHTRVKNVLMIHKTCRSAFDFIRSKHVLGASIDMGVCNA